MSVAYVAWDKQDAMRLYEMVLGGSMLPKVCLCLPQSIRSTPCRAFDRLPAKDMTAHLGARPEGQLGTIRPAGNGGGEGWIARRLLRAACRHPTFLHTPHNCIGCGVY